MRLKVVLALGMLLGCATDEADDSGSWFDGWVADDSLDTGDGLAGPRITITTPDGPMTLDAVDGAGVATQLTGGVFFEETFYFSDGVARTRLDTETLAQVERLPWVDLNGVAVAVDSMVSLTYRDEPLLVVLEGAGLRIFDPATERLTEPFPMLVDPGDGVAVPFSPKSWIYVDGLAAISETPFLAVTGDGALYIGSATGFFSVLIPELTECTSAALVQPTGVLAPILREHGPIVPESLLFVEADQVWVFDLSPGELCLSPYAMAVDENSDPIAPSHGFVADTTGDGLDAIVWVHE